MKEAPGTTTSSDVNYIFPKLENEPSKPLLFVLVALGIGGLGLIGVGIAGSTGAISNLNHIHSMLIILNGVLLIPFGAAGVNELRKPSHSFYTYSYDIFERGLLNKEQIERSFGFQIVAGFTPKETGGYIIAENPKYPGDSPLKSAKADLLGVISNKRRNPDAELPDTLSDTIDIAAQEYKIHLMPKPEHMKQVVGRLIDRIAEDEELKAHIAQYKVMLGQANEEGEVEVPILKDSQDGYYPRIVIYAESQAAGQAILNAVLELFPDSDGLGDDLLPRENVKVNKLVFYANGSGGIKEGAKETGILLDNYGKEEYALYY